MVDHQIRPWNTAGSHQVNLIEQLDDALQYRRLETINGDLLVEEGKEALCLPFKA
jgi:hypothetical protein